MRSDPSPLLDRLLSWSDRRAPSTAFRYATATVVVVAIGLLRALVLGPLVPRLLFIPIVLVAALVFGRRVGIYSSFLAALVAAVTTGSGHEPLWLTASQWASSALFVLVASGIAVLGGELKAAFARVHQLVTDKEIAQSTLRTVFETAPVGLSLAAADGTSILINEQMRWMLGRDISKGGIARYLGSAVHGGGEPYALDDYPQVAAIRLGVSTECAPFLIERPDGTRVRTEISSVPLRDPAGTITGAVSAVINVEGREQAMERQAMLIGELAHRMKNTMAMVQAIVHQSLRSAATLAEARESVTTRFQALARAQDRLTAADWRLTDLGDIVRGALEVANHAGRIGIGGPAVQVGARAALSFTLVLHELATNALKYGALSTPEGRVQVNWRFVSAEAGDGVRLDWAEIDGPAVQAPSRKGFGSRLVDIVGRGFGGTSGLSYDPAGVRWFVEAGVEDLRRS